MLDSIAIQATTTMLVRLHGEQKGCSSWTLLIFKDLKKGFLFFAEDQDPKNIAAKPTKIPSQMDNFLREIFSRVTHRHKSLLAFIF